MPDLASTEQTTTPDPAPAPWTVHFRDGMWEVTCSDGSLGGRFPREGDARTFADVAGPGPMTIVSKNRLDRLTEATPGRMEDRWALDDIAVLVGFHRDAHPAEVVRAVRAELARVRPVVDAARAWCEGRAPSSVLYEAVAALVGDAAATPQPAEPEAGNVDVGALGALIDTLALDVYAAAHGCEASEVNAGDDGLGDVRQVLADAAPGLHAARATRSSAPPADAPAGLRAAAKVLDEGDVYLGVTREANALRRLADTIEADPSGATSQAIVRALATPTTDTES